MKQICVFQFLIILSFSLVELKAQQNKTPNIIILLADDLGYADLGCYGSNKVHTPVLDKLAKDGMRYTDFYAASTVCSPSRAALMTGRFSLRTGIYSWIHTSHTMHLQREENTIAELLKRSGYKTAHMGKWHLGYDLEEGSGNGPTPTDHGFDHWLATGNNARPSHHNPDNFIRNGKALGEISGYSSQVVADEAIAWLDTNAGSEHPFFLNLWFHEPHVPNAAPPALTEKHNNTSSPAYYGSIENMDANIGRVLEKLDDMKLSANSLVIFMSDNGSVHGKEGSNGMFKEGKTSLWEGGIRVPCIMRWPEAITAGSINKTPAGMVDILPTLSAMAGVSLPAGKIIDGVSLLNVFRGQPLVRNKPLYWFYAASRPICVIREDNWSLIADPELDIPVNNLFKEEWIGLVKKTGLVNFRLYDLDKDPGQVHDVSASNKQRFETMKKKMIELHREVVAEAMDWRTTSAN